MKKSDIINDIISTREYSVYWEIGHGNGETFDAVVCETKASCDIEGGKGTFHGSSDEFFVDMAKKGLKAELIFIDGDHRHEQVELDIVNAWYRLKAGGVILVHDVRPFTEEMQIVPRKQTQWTGDVWRAAAGFRKNYPRIGTFYIDEKYGIFGIEKKNIALSTGFSDLDMTYGAFRDDWKKLLGHEG